MDIISRGTFRTQLTKLANAAQEYLLSAESQTVLTNAHNFDTIEEECDVYLQRVTAVRENLLKANAELKPSIKREDFQKECEGVAEYEDKATAIISRLKVRLNKLAQIRSRELGKANPPLPHEGPHSTVTAAKLPHLALKTFSGNFKEWIPFWERFRTAVHERQNLSEADKFNYLQHHLMGKAAESIAGFIPSEENYDAAISMLQDEYGNSEKLIDFTMQQLTALQTVVSRRDISGLRKLYNDVTTHTRSLTALGVSSNKYSVMLKPLLLKCIPKELVIEYYRNFGNRSETAIKENTNEGMHDSDINSEADNNTSINISHDSQLGSIMKFLKREVESLEQSSPITVHNSQTSSHQKVIKSAAGLMTADGATRCCFCKSTRHSSQKCDSSTTLHQKKEILKQEGRCFRCTGKGHSARNCANKSIKCLKCNGRHATSMCDPSYRPSAMAKSPSKDKYSEEKLVTSPNSANLCSVSCQSPDILLQTARAVVMPTSLQRSASVTVRAILDGGSQRTYIKESVVAKLGIKSVDTVNLRILPFGSHQKLPAKEFKRVRVQVRSVYDGKSISLLAVVVPNICMDVLPVPPVDSNLFSGILLADNSNFSLTEDGLSLLVGADYYWQIVLDEKRRLSHNLVAINTILGWTIQGSNCIKDCDNLPISEACSFLSICDDDQCAIRSFWDLEGMGIIDPPANEKVFGDFIRKNGQRYEGSLLWRNPTCRIESNKEGAIVRFNKLLRKLSRVPQDLLKYDSIMWEMIENGIAERVPNDKDISDKIYYMPHRPVYRPDKIMTDLRIVFDASARTGNSLSLNQHLFQGPNLLPDILVILLNFRVGPTALVADIEKAFHQISLNKKDRDSHRFFWFEKRMSDPKKLPARVEYRMTRVTFGVACSPYLLCAALQKLFSTMSKLYPKTAPILSNAFYMDDFVVSVNEGETAYQLYTQTCKIMGEASMNIRKWNSNDPQLRERFKGASCPANQKVLGVKWSCDNDELITEFAKVSELSRTPTKRTVLSFIASTYDPLGILGPFIVSFKILFQECWKLRLDWDETLPPHLQIVWNKISKQVVSLEEVKIPRCCFTSPEFINVQLHLFADASPQAYGCVAYVRSTYSDKTVCVRYLCSKNRVAPLKGNNSNELTLPKLELTAALIASRLASYIQKNLQLKFNNVFFWTDSKIVLSWITHDIQCNKPYIGNRVQEIRSLSDVSDWRHCPGVLNPADYLTRVALKKRSELPTTWLNGPEWLAQDDNNWPSINFLPDLSKTLICLQVTDQNEQPIVASLFNIERFGRYRKILRITAYVLRFIGRVRNKITYRSFLSSTEILLAEEYWIKLTQRIHFSGEIKCLEAGKQIWKSSSILTLQPFMDDAKILRVGTRLQEAKFDFNETFPIILPKSSYFSLLLVLDVHERTLHGGVNVTLVRLRERFWIIKSRQLIKRIIKRCVVCKKLKGLPGVQPTAPLPRIRLSTSRAFETTGIDFAGPVYGKLTKGDLETKKFYFMILTCAVIRAVHLELVPSLNTEDCILALRRFFARRGTPRKILSDNARTFKRASTELRSLGPVIVSSYLHDFASKEGIQWDFIAERAAWWGGFWERLVKVVKDVLKITIGKAVLTKDQLETILCEAEAVVNARPLTYVSDDPEDLSPLTPSKFLIGNYLPNSISEKEEPVEADIRAAWKIRLRLTNKFAKRFKTEYLQSLRSAHHSKTSFSTIINEGDVVLVHDNLTPRTFWKLAVVLNTYPGRDGRVRACEIRFPNGFVTRRAIQHLYPLELHVSTARPEDVKNIS